MYYRLKDKEGRELELVGRRGRIETPGELVVLINNRLTNPGLEFKPRFPWMIERLVFGPRAGIR